MEKRSNQLPEFRRMTDIQRMTVFLTLGMKDNLCNIDFSFNQFMKTQSKKESPSCHYQFSAAQFNPQTRRRSSALNKVGHDGTYEKGQRKKGQRQKGGVILKSLQEHWIYFAGTLPFLYFGCSRRNSCPFSISFRGSVIILSV